MFKISKENKKLIFGIILAAVVFLSYQVIASYMTNPVDTSLKYPNPGHYPGEIGPGTFNASNSTNPYWSFPDSSGDRFTGLEIRNGSGQFYKTLQVFNNFYTYANTYLGNDSSDKTTVKGNLEVSGKGTFNELCVGTDCYPWEGGTGGFGECEVVTSKHLDSVTATCPSGKVLTGCECSYDEVRDHSVLQSKPNTTTNSCYCHDGSSNKPMVIAHAICCKGGSGGGTGGGEFDSCEIVNKTKVFAHSPVRYGESNVGSITVSCPSDKWLVSGGGKMEDIYQSYPLTSGKGGTWYIYGKGYLDWDSYHEEQFYYGDAYAVCCNFTGGAGTIEDLWVNETGDTMTGDLNVTGGIVVGNPDEGNKGAGTINAEKIYVNGSEVSGGLSILGICGEMKGIQSAYCCPPSGVGCYWRDETTCWGATGSAECNSYSPCNPDDYCSVSYVIEVAHKKCECTEGSLYCVQVYRDAMYGRTGGPFVAESYICYCLG